MYFGMKRTLLLMICFCLLLSTAWCNIAEIKWEKEQLRNWGSQEIPSSINLDDLGSEEEQKCGNFSIEEERTCGNYRVTIYKDKDDIEMLLKILKKNKVVYSERGHHFRVGLIYDDMPEDKLVRSCKDITRNGKPNLVVSEWSGGAHCCYTFRVFSLGKDFRQIALIDGGDGDYSKFVDVDRDGVLEFLGRDWTYAYWNTCFAGSPAPEVILKYRNGTYAISSWGGIRKLPRAFTQEGVAMLSSVLNSERAIAVNIQIMRVFAQFRRMLLTNSQLKRKIEEIEKKYDKQFAIVFQAIKQLLEPAPIKPKPTIGFHVAS